MNPATIMGFLMHQPGNSSGFINLYMLSDSAAIMQLGDIISLQSVVRILLYRNTYQQKCRWAPVSLIYYGFDSRKLRDRHVNVSGCGSKNSLRCTNVTFCIVLGWASAGVCNRLPASATADARSHTLQSCASSSMMPVDMIQRKRKG